MLQINLYNYIIVITKYWWGQKILCPTLSKSWGDMSALKLGPWSIVVVNPYSG